MPGRHRAICCVTRASTAPPLPPGGAADGTAVFVPPTKDQRRSMPAILQKITAEWCNRIETAFGEITDQMALARHGAHTFWGLLTRTAATIAAHTLLRMCLDGQ